MKWINLLIWIQELDYFINFEEYSVEELYDIFERKLNKARPGISEEAKEEVLNVLRDIKDKERFDNGRFIY